jgi:hypothetical protein
METIKVKFGHGVDVDTETRNRLSDNGWTIDYCEKEHGIPLNQNAEVQWHMDRMDAIREKQKSKNRKPKPIKNKGEFKHPSTRTINCIGVEAAYDTTEGREYRRKQKEDFEEFKRNNC